MQRTGVIKLLTLLSILGMPWTAGAGAPGKISVFVSIEPQKYFVQKVGGERVDVAVMVEPGASPADYEPKPRQMMALSESRIYFAIGVSFETAWLPRFAACNRRMQVVQSQAGIEKIPMKSRPHAVREPGKEGPDAGRAADEDAGQHRHGIMDPHVWLSPPLVKTLAGNILQALTAVDPDHRCAYETNYRHFITELNALDAEIREMLTGKGAGVQFLVFHPAWAYFAQAYGLVQIPIEIEGKEPRPADLRRLITHARSGGIKVVLVQPQFSTRSARVIADAIGGQIVFANPLAPDWSGNLRRVAATVKAALR